MDETTRKEVLRMKKLCLLLALLLCVSLSAQAQGYEDYTIGRGEPIMLYPLDGHNTVVRCWPSRGKNYDTEPWHLVWYRDGQEYRHLPYYAKGATGDLDHTDFLLNADGGVQVLLYRNDGTFLYDWTDNGLENPAALPSGWGYRVCGPYLAATRPGEGQALEVTLQKGGETIWSGKLPGCAGSALRDVWAFKENGYLLRTEKGNASLLTCIKGDTVLYQVTPEPGMYLPDGQGGFLDVQGNHSGDYTPLTIYHYDVSGRQDKQYVLRGEKLVTSLDGAVRNEETGNLILYGGAVANSRRVYTVFSLTLDQDLNPVSWDFRDLPAKYRDYSPKVYLAPDSTPYVYIWAVGLENAFTYPPAFPPFETLPTAALQPLAWKETFTWHPGVHPN